MTFGTYNIPEVYILAFTLLKITMILPNYFIREINTLAVVFLLNSMTSYSLSYVFAQRTCVVLELPIRKLKFNRYMFITVVCIFALIMFIVPLFDPFNSQNDKWNGYNLLLHCN